MSYLRKLRLAIGLITSALFAANCVQPIHAKTADSFLMRESVASTIPAGWSGDFVWTNYFGGETKKISIQCRSETDMCVLNGFGSGTPITFNRKIDASAVTKGYKDAANVYAVSNVVWAVGSDFSADPGWTEGCTPWPRCESTAKRIDAVWLVSNVSGVPVEPWTMIGFRGLKLGENLGTNSRSTISNVRLVMTLFYEEGRFGLYAVWGGATDKDCLRDASQCLSIGLGEARTETKRQPAKPRQTSTTSTTSTSLPANEFLPSAILDDHKPLIWGKEVNLVFRLVCQSRVEIEDGYSSIPVGRFSFDTNSQIIERQGKLNGKEIVYRLTVRDSGGQASSIDPEYGATLMMTSSFTSENRFPKQCGQIKSIAFKTPVQIQEPTFTDNPWVPTRIELKPRSCPKVLILGFRGSGQKPRNFDWGVLDDRERIVVAKDVFAWKSRSDAEYFAKPSDSKSLHYDSLGTTVGRYVQQMRQVIQSRSIREGKRIEFSEIGFWSVGVDDAHLALGDRLRSNFLGFKTQEFEPYYRAVGAAPKALATTYSSDVNTDLLKILEVWTNVLIRVTSRCREAGSPVQNILIVGYSQGAIMARALAARWLALPAAVGSQPELNGLLLVADPLFSLDDTCCGAWKFELLGFPAITTRVSTGGIAGFGPRDGFDKYFLEEEFDLKKLARRVPVVTICAEGDLVCTGVGLLNKVHSKHYVNQTSCWILKQIDVLLDMGRNLDQDPEKRLLASLKWSVDVIGYPKRCQ